MKHFRLFVIILVSSACVAASTAYSGNLLLMIAPLLGKKNSSSYGDMNTVAKLISVSSGNSDSLTADWLPSQDDQTPASQIRYTLHVSTDEDFLPSAATAKGTVVGKETLTVTGLEPDTQYFVLVAAADGSGNESWSNRLQARTVAGEAIRTSAVVEEQTASQNPTVTANTVSYTSDKLPAAGEYLVSSAGDGYLRKVVSATSANGVVTAQTEDASLNEVLEQYQLSTTVKLAALPATGSSAPAMMRAADGSGQMPARQHRWEKSGLILKDSNQDTANNRIVSTASGKLVAASYIPLQTKDGQHSYMTGPKYLASSPGTTLNSTINVKVASKKDEQICKIVLSEFTHDDSTLSKLPPPTSNQTIAADKKSGSLQLHFSPTNSYLDSKNRPYEARVIAYIDEKGEGCNGDDYPWTTWDDELEMKIPVYVERGRLEVEDEEKTVTFSGDFSVTNKAEMTFEPELNIDVQASTFSLKSADFIAKANIGLSNTLTITASAEGNLSKTVTLLNKREFIKVFPVGGVPVVVRGAFSMDARIDGHIGGKATLTKFMELSFPATTFGVQYRDSKWQTVKNFDPKYTFRIDGEADADAEISLTLIPDLQIHFYEAASGRMILEPALYAEAALHGQFKYQDADGNKLTDLDYWFSYINAGVSLDMRLYAGLHVLDHNIISWPEDVSYTETDKFNHFQPITREKGKMYSLPTLTAAADEEPDSPPDSRAILISGTATDFITPLFGSNLNPFQKWTEPKVISDRTYSITPLDESLAQHWFIPKQAGDFTVRLGGHSKLGWFVRQVAEVPLSLPDTDADGLPDYWESRFGITAATEDDDSDGLDNAAEFSYGTNPINADSDGGGTSDGQEIADGTNPLDGSDDISHAIAVLTASGSSVAEGNSGTKQLEFTLNLDQFYGTASVDYTTKDGTATTAGNDYVAEYGTVTFLGGSTSEKVSITVNGDTDVEPDETFSLQLSNPVNLTLASSSATGTIVNDDSATAGTVVSATGRVWMDRNLGAARVATSVDDEQAYGDLYQWGRLTDGHEKRDSETTSVRSSSDIPGHSKFILSPLFPYDWRISKNDSLWQGVNGINNPCPTGFRLPTADEWQEEIDSWSSQDVAGAFASPLKLVTTGFRLYKDGSLNWVDTNGYFWSSAVYGDYALYLNFGDTFANIYNYARSDAFSIRCIKDGATQTSSVLNDTGITWSGNYASGNNTACIASTTPNGDNVVAAQDCSHGRDATDNDDSDGHAGFSYTKLDSNGVPLDDQSADYATTPWACVKDNVTGLIWEVKTDDGGLHDKDDEYNWYNTDPASNGGADGYADDDGDICYGYNSSDSSTFCNTQAYVNRVNAAGWCGASDWRMPTRKELNSIVHHGSYNPAIDINYFPNTTSSWFWSGSPYAGDSDVAWYVNFNYGLSFNVSRGYGSYAVRLVRGGQ